LECRHQRAEGAGAGLVRIGGCRRVVGSALVGAKHEPIALGVVEGEAHVGATHGRDPVHRLAPRRCRRSGQPIAEKVEALRHDRAHEVIAVGEVVVRRRVADAGTPRHLAQGEAIDPALGQELQARVQQRPPKVAVVIAPSRHDPSNLTVSRSYVILPLTRYSTHTGRKPIE
jgi:hypothetical protein